MSEETALAIVVALITTLGLIMVALINRTRIHSKVSREQLENDHAGEGSSENKIPNIRENIDANQSKILEKLEHMDEKFDGLADTVRRQGNKVDKLFEITRKLEEKGAN